MHQLTEHQVDLLVDILIEECGFGLSDDQIADQVAMLLEDVPGFEVVSDDALSQTINRVRSAYHVANQH